MRKPALAPDREDIVRIASQRRLRTHFHPSRRRIVQPLRFLLVRRLTAQIAAFEGKGLRIIFLEKTGVYHDATNQTRQRETNNAPIVSGGAPPPRFPSVHPLPARRVFSFDEDRLCFPQQVLLRREEVIVCQNRLAAQPLRRQVGKLREILHAWSRRSTVPMGSAANCPCSKTISPRTKVASTTPESSRPA